MQPRTLAVQIDSLNEGAMTVTSATTFYLQHGKPRRERYFVTDAAKLDSFLHGRAALHVFLDGRTVRISSYIRGN